MKKVLIIFLACFLFWGCSSGYNARGALGGYSEKKLESGDFEVKFVGNGYTSEKKVIKYLLRRCSEVTLENGQKYFEVKEDNSTSKSTEHYNSNSGHYTTTFFTGCYIIKMYPEKPEKISEKIYSAKRFLERNNF